MFWSLQMKKLSGESVIYESHGNQCQPASHKPQEALNHYGMVPQMVNQPINALIRAIDNAIISKRVLKLVDGLYNLTARHPRTITLHI